MNFQYVFARARICAPATISSHGQYSNLIVQFSTHFLMKWRCILKCFALAWYSELCQRDCSLSFKRISCPWASRPSSFNTFLIQIHSFTVSMIATYSASVVQVATIACSYRSQNRSNLSMRSIFSVCNLNYSQFRPFFFAHPQWRVHRMRCLQISSGRDDAWNCLTYRRGTLK